MTLDIRTAAIQVQDAVVCAIELAYARRYPEAQNLAGLALVDDAKLRNRALVFVVEEGVVYQLRRGNTQPVVYPEVIETASGNGRWIRQYSSVTFGPNYTKPLHRVRYGYAATVEAFQGEDGELLERLFGQRPALVVQLVNDEYELRGQRHGGIYDAKWTFVLHATAWNARHGTDALYGSEVESDSGITPERGVYRMIGDLRYLLAGSDLGLGTAVKFTSIDGAANLAVSDLGQRYFRAEVDVTVHGTVHRIDEDLIYPFTLSIERFETGTEEEGVFDPRNFVSSGLQVLPQPGLSAAPSSGAAYVDGELVTLIPGLHLFSANSDTYRDLLPSGTFVYQAVEVNAPPPAVTPNALRVGKTITSASEIIGDALLCSYRLTSAPTSGDPFQVTT